MILGVTASGFAGGLSVSDDFNRADGPLGVTPTNSLPWQTFSGTFVIASNKAASSPTNTTSGLAVVDNFASNVSLSLGVSAGGGDALYFRVVDADNWWRTHVNSVTTQQYYSTGYTQYQWSNYVSGAEYYPTTAQYSAGCQQTYHDHGESLVYTWSTSPSFNSSPVYTTYSHSHSLSLAGCGQTVTFSHSHYASGSYTGTSQFVSTGSGVVDVTTATVTLVKRVSGTNTDVGTYQDNSVTSIQVVANGSSIEVKTNNNATTRISANSADHVTATKHGIGRGTTTNSGTSMDNFSAIPIGAP